MLSKFEYYVEKHIDVKSQAQPQKLIRFFVQNWLKDSEYVYAVISSYSRSVYQRHDPIIFYQQECVKNSY